MKAPVLVVRTVSVEKLSAVLDACREGWPGHPLIVVTSVARGSELQTDPRIAEIVPYATGAEGFVVPIYTEHALEAVVVPVANGGGNGYANVMRACRQLQTSRWFLASYSRELIELTRLQWTLRWWSELALQQPAEWLGKIWGRRIRSLERPPTPR